MHHFLKRVLPLFLCCSILFVGCTRQKKIDLAEFCKCFNTEEKKETLSSSAFLKTEEDGNPCYHVPITLSQNGTAFFTLESGTDGALNGLQLTLLKSDVKDVATAPKELFAFFQTAVAILENEMPDTLEATFQSIGLQKDSIQFSPFYFTETKDRVTYTVLCRPEGIALFCKLL